MGSGFLVHHYIIVINICGIFVWLPRHPALQTIATQELATAHFEKEMQQLLKSTADLTASLAAARAECDQLQAASQHESEVAQRELAEQQATARATEQGWASRLAAQEAVLRDQQTLLAAKVQELAEATKRLEEERLLKEEMSRSLEGKAEEAADWKRAADEVCAYVR